MKNETETGKRLYLENRKLRLMLETVTRRLEGFCEGRTNLPRARAEIRRARMVLDQTKSLD